MAPNRWTVLLLSLAAVSLTAATCNKGPPPAPIEQPGPEPVKAEEKPAADDPTGMAATGADPRKALTGIPGMDFSSLTPSAQKELATVFNDEFCYCGCPHTLGACLKEHPNCRHAKRMAILAASDAAAGVPAVETIVALSKHYASFSQKRLELNVDPRQCQGPEDAKVTLIEFSDFECPYCAAALPLLKDFVKRSGKVRLCWSAFPLANHANAVPAANAVMFARDQGKFWQLHDALFENQAALSQELIVQLGAGLGLDKAALGKAMSSNAYGAQLNTSKDAARAAGVDSTPTLFINGRKHTLPFDQAALQHAVDDELEWMQHRGWAPDPG